MPRCMSRSEHVPSLSTSKRSSLDRVAGCAVVVEQSTWSILMPLCLSRGSSVKVKSRHDTPARFFHPAGARLAANAQVRYGITKTVPTMKRSFMRGPYSCSRVIILERPVAQQQASALQVCILQERAAVRTAEWVNNSHSTDLFTPERGVLERSTGSQQVSMLWVPEIVNSFPRG